MKKTRNSGLKITYLEKPETDFLLSTSFDKNHDHYMLFKTLLETGLRISELCSLTPNNHKTFERKIFVIGKGNKMRYIDLRPEFSLELATYIKNCKIQKAERIFPNTRQSYLWVCKKYMPNLYPHKLRHTYCINLLRTVDNIIYVQRQMGHKFLDTTAQYLQFKEFNEEKKKLGNLYGI